MLKHLLSLSLSAITVVLPSLQGATEGILDRCAYLRVNGQERVPLTQELKDQILSLAISYGTGRLLAVFTTMCVCVCGSRIRGQCGRAV